MRLALCQTYDDLYQKGSDPWLDRRVGCFARWGVGQKERPLVEEPVALISSVCRQKA